MFLKSSNAMSPFFAAIFLHGLCLANAVNFTTVYEWDNFDFIWPSEANNSKGETDQKFYSDNVLPRYMAVFGERLFLSLDFGTPATLVWLPTSGTSTAPPKLAPFPSLDLHKANNCDTIQWAKGMETDTDGRLWVLDNGSSSCPSKLWIFDLLNHDTTDRVHQFPHSVVSHSIGGRRMYDMVLDKNPDDDLAYTTDYHSEYIVVYSRKLDKSWTVKTPGRTWFSLAVSPNREARQLYIKKSRSKELYSVSVSELKNEGGSAAPKLVGEFAEMPYRMVIDGANVLYAAFYRKTYFTKWNISEPFREQHFYETGYLDSNWPFTFAFDSNDTFWLTVRDETDEINGYRHKLLKAAVGARS
ncbi:protein yellow-like [Cloeon dipterum]|uniref:protein yellow-like n=1 Tax=Cloeon dipterum TaxID=197152 RepID=UPI00321FFA02